MGLPTTASLRVLLPALGLALASCSSVVAESTMPGERSVDLLPPTFAGNIELTKRQLDVAISGSGMFQVELPDGSYGYTRFGGFGLDRDGHLITSGGHPIVPQIQLGHDALDISISQEGEIVGRFASAPDQTVSLGSFQLHQMPLGQELWQVLPGVFQLREGGEPAVTAAPGEKGLGLLQQGFVENRAGEMFGNHVITQDIDDLPADYAIPTLREFDFAIRGRGMLRVQLPDGSHGYTRNGGLRVDREGDLVTRGGHRVEPRITLSQDVLGVFISPKGDVLGRTASNPGVDTCFGALLLHRFSSTESLLPIGRGLFAATEQSGTPHSGRPGEAGLGFLQQGYLEAAYHPARHAPIWPDEQMPGRGARVPVAAIAPQGQLRLPN